MIDIFNSDAFAATSIALALKNIPYKPSRLGPGGLNLFDEKPIATTSVSIEAADGQLSLIGTSPRGAPGDFIGNGKSKLIPFNANHLRRNAKVFADEVQNVRMFGTEDQMQSVEMKRNEKLALLQAMHEVTWEFHRVGAVTGVILDADGSTVLLNLFTVFDVVQQTKDFILSVPTTDVLAASEAVADLIDAELGASSYSSIHVLCGAAFYDALASHAYIRTALLAQQSSRLLEDRRGGFTIGPLTFERAKRWRVKSPSGTMLDLINTDVAYAFPVGVTTNEGNMFIGRFAPQPFLDTVNRLNPPLVVKTVVDPADQFVDLIGISCPLYLNTRPRAVIKLTKS